MSAKNPWTTADIYKSVHRLRLFIAVVLIVFVLSFVKIIIHWSGMEFLSLNALFTSAIASAVFIIGFLLSSVLADYKEADRMPAEIRTALESLKDDSLAHALRNREYSHKDMRLALVGFVESLLAAFDSHSGHRFTPTADAIDNILSCISQMERTGLPPNYVARLKSDISVLRKCIFRMHHIQRIQFVPSVHVLVKSLVFAILFLLLFLKTEGSPESALIFGAISYMFIYALHLISTLEQPFTRLRPSMDDVSLFLLREFSMNNKDTD